MRVIESRKVEDCIDGSRILEVRLDGDSTEPLVRHLGKLGRLDYFPEFARPFYRIILDRRFLIRGVEGAPTFQIIVFSSPEAELDFIGSHIRGFSS